MGKEVKMRVTLKSPLLDFLGKEIELTEEEIRVWEKEGITRENIPQWASLGFNPQGARKWKGVTPEVAFTATIYGFTPTEAKRWIKQGFGDSFWTVPAWKRRGFTPHEAREWASYGFLPKQAEELKKKYSTPHKFAAEMEKRTSTMFEALIFYLAETTQKDSRIKSALRQVATVSQREIREKIEKSI